MSTLVEGRAREQYFARRAAVVQLMLLLSFVSAGLLLFGAQTASVSALWMFALLNLFGLTARLLSVTCLALQPDPMQEAVSAKSWIRLRDAVKGSNWKIASYVAVLFFGAHTAVPFFTPYMLRELRMDYATYATLIAVPIAVRALCSPFLFVAAQRVGMRALFITSTGLIAVVALLWALFASFEALFLAQILSGLAWGMFEYASYQLLLQSSPEATRVEFLSLANAMAGAAQLSGALLGGILLMTDAIGYQAVFLLSAGARALPVAFAFAVLPKRLPTIARLVTRVVSVRPSGGTVERPIVTRETDKHE